MRLGLLTTVHVREPAALGNLRVLIDSIHRHVPRSAYTHLLIVDDCSPDLPAAPYYAHLAREGVEVYRMGPPRPPYWGRKYGLDARGAPTSYGHAVGLMAGFEALRARGCTHAWVIDGDCVVLDAAGAWLPQAIDLFQHDRVAVVTDAFGCRPGPAPEIIDAEWTLQGETRRLKAALPVKGAWINYGFPVLFCALVDLAVEPAFGLLANEGWVNAKWGAQLFKQGRRVGYFPFFQHRHVFHLGLGYTKTNMIVASQPFGMATDEVGRYGGRDRGYYHAGFLQIDRDSARHQAWLAGVTGLPVADRAALDPAWLRDPPIVPTAPDEYTLRPLGPDDFAALWAFDTDPEATRFMAWGPRRAGDEALTRTFLARAAATRWQHFGFVRHGELIGMGEIRPLSADRAGLCYAILRPYWRQGHGERLLNALIEVAYNQHGYATLEVAIDAAHVASLGVLGKRHDFATDWIAQRERYTLKGEARTRIVFTRRLPVGPVPIDAAAGLRQRADLLASMGVWRPAS